MCQRRSRVCGPGLNNWSGGLPDCRVVLVALVVVVVVVEGGGSGGGGDNERRLTYYIINEILKPCEMGIPGSLAHNSSLGCRK